MPSPVKLGVLAAILLLIPASAAWSACSAPAFSAAQRNTIQVAAPNQALFSAALVLALNQQRCQAGRDPMTTAANHIKAATFHSENMVKTRKFSHRSSVAGQRTFKDRARLAGMSFRYLAENIARRPRFNFPLGKSFRVVNRSSCRFADPATGKTIAAHSYASLAQSVTAQWMASSGHRKNILNRKSKRTGAAVAFDARAANCGDFYITQIYSD